MWVTHGIGGSTDTAVDVCGVLVECSAPAVRSRSPEKSYTWDQWSSWQNVWPLLSKGSAQPLLQEHFGGTGDHAPFPYWDQLEFPDGDRADVARFLESQEDLKDHLLGSLPILGRFFPSDPLGLALVIDGDNTAWRYLELFPMTTFEPEIALKYLTEADGLLIGRWPSGVAERLCLSVRFR